MASHRRPVSVLATGTDEELVERAGAWRQDYTGPTGAQSVLQVMLGDAGIPTLALWAQVPHYLAGGAVAAGDPRACSSGCATSAGVAVDLDGLDDQADAYVQRVEEGLVRPSRRGRGDRGDRGRRGRGRRDELPERRRARLRDRAVPPRPELNHANRPGARA